MDVYDNILERIGDTPLVRMHRIARNLQPTILAKVEYLNPGGSVKDRIGIRMIEDAASRARCDPVERSSSLSGNTGAGLAMAAAIKGYRCIFVMPDKMSNEKFRC
jgi:cystathionine beta-synthase